MTNKSKKGSEKTEKTSTGDENSNTIRVSNNHNAVFYIKAATNFLHGVTGKDGIEKKVFDEIVVSALGVAISTAVQVCATLEERGVGEIVKTETAYIQLEYGKMPQVQCTVKRNPSYTPPPREPSQKVAPDRLKFADGPACPDRLKDEKMEKKMKKVMKEGGKRGVEIEGASDMGGTRYFPTKVLEPEGDVEMLIECVKAMNEKCDPSEEERKGGSGNVGKLVMSIEKKEELMSICVYVPPSFTDFQADTWLTELLKKLEVPNNNQDPFKWHVSNACYAAICIKNNKDAGVFCVKLKDYVIQRSNDILISRELIPPFDDDSDDDCCYGDDDLGF